MDKLQPPTAAVGFIHLLGTNNRYGARPDPRKNGHNPWHQRPEVVDVIAYGANCDHGDLKQRQVLLILQIPVHREEDIELPGGPAQEFAVLDAGPATLGDRSRLVPRQVPLQLPG